MFDVYVSRLLETYRENQRTEGERVALMLCVVLGRYHGERSLSGDDGNVDVVERGKSRGIASSVRSLPW